MNTSTRLLAGDPIFQRAQNQQLKNTHNEYKYEAACRRSVYQQEQRQKIWKEVSRLHRISETDQPLAETAIASKQPPTDSL